MTLPPEKRPAEILNAGQQGEIAHGWQQDWQLLSCAIAAVLLVIAVAQENGDGFYTFLRIYVAGLSLVLALSFSRQRRLIWLLASLMTAILFNPIIPIEMEREEWAIYDLGAAAGFAWIGLSGQMAAPGMPRLKRGTLAGAAIVAAVAIGTYLWSAVAERYRDDDNNMAVENLIAENLVVENDLDASAFPSPYDDNALAAAGSAIDNALRATSPPDPSYQQIGNAQVSSSEVAANTDGAARDSTEVDNDLANRVDDLSANNTAASGPEE